MSADNRYLNRESSWLEFNARVLDEALDTKTPLLERIKFLSIFSTNQDEFFMVRVAGLKMNHKDGLSYPSDAEVEQNETISRTLEVIRTKSKKLVDQQYRCLTKTVLPELRESGIHVAGYKELSAAEKKRLRKYFHESVLPILTPLAVDSSHPFPFLTNLAVYLLAEFSNGESNNTHDDVIGFVEIPSVLPRLVLVSEEPNVHKYILLDDLVKAHLGDLFVGHKVKFCTSIRVTRNLDYHLIEDRVVNLLESVQKEVLNREHQEAVRLEISEALPDHILGRVVGVLKIDESDLFYCQGPLCLSDFMQLYDLPFSHLKEKEFNPRIPSRLADSESLFAIIQRKDMLLHHPYDSFFAVASFLSEAASDPHVLAIKQTLYRSSGRSPIIELLIKASEAGKHVTAVVELKARFDEKNNIVWARRLERAGVNVVYGFVGLKTHCKACLVVRKEGQKIMRYVHLSTGNYNAQTARHYTDLGLFTADKEIGQDISVLFNLLTGFNQFRSLENGKRVADTSQLTKICIAPTDLREKFVSEIKRVVKNQSKDKPGVIFAKINALGDRVIIDELYRASKHGVQIKLIVRGVCCLRPGVPGLSENIEVVSIVDRFLEHSRVYCFCIGEERRVFLGSADWLERSMERRVEVIFPIEDEEVKIRIVSEVLDTYWRDNVKARILKSDGSYVFKRGGSKGFRAQNFLIEIARKGGLKSIPYDRAFRKGDLKRSKLFLIKKN